MSGLSDIMPVGGIEPPSMPYESTALPLSYAGLLKSKSLVRL